MMSSESTLAVMQVRHQTIKIIDEGAPEYPLSTLFNLRINPTHWTIFGHQVKRTFEIDSKGIPAQVREDALDFIREWTEIESGIERDNLANLKAGGVEIPEGPEEPVRSEPVYGSAAVSSPGFLNSASTKTVVTDVNVTNTKPESWGQKFQKATASQDAYYEEVGTQEVVTLPAPVGIGGIVRPAVSAVEAVAAWREFQALRGLILEKTDFQHIANKDFIKKSGWRKFATFYNLTDRIVEEVQVPLEKGFYWKIKVLCTAPNGRETEGVAMCASSEKSGPRILHDTYTTAHTRAKNRAISDMIAAGEVSAEEVE